MGTMCFYLFLPFLIPFPLRDSCPLRPRFPAYHYLSRHYSLACSRLLYYFRRHILGWGIQSAHADASVIGGGERQRSAEQLCEHDIVLYSSPRTTREYCGTVASILPPFHCTSTSIRVRDLRVESYFKLIHSAPGFLPSLSEKC